MEKEQIVYYPLVLNMKTKALQIQDQIKKNLNETLLFTDEIEKANVILVIWWDWFLLDAISKYQYLNKPFFWINCWTLGFLLNNIIDINKLPKYTNEIAFIQEHLLKVKITKSNYEEVIKYAVNDVVIWNSLNWYFQINIEWETFRYGMRWTGLIVSTPIWSTWYRLNGWWPLIPINSDIVWIMWNFTRPFKFDNVRNQKMKINIEWRESINARVDWNTWLVEDIIWLEIQKSQKTFQLWFSNIKEFETKRIMLCSEKLWWRCW